MKTTVTLTDENAAGLAWCVELTGLSLEEIVNISWPMKYKSSGQTMTRTSRLGPERFPREAAQECERFIHEVLDELAKLPECAEPNWLEGMEEEG